MPERATVTAEVPHVQHLADDALLDELVGFSVRTHPLERPVDHEGPVRWHGADHGVGLLEGTGERFFDDDVCAEGGDFFDPLAVLGGGGAEDDDVWGGLCETLRVVGEDALFGDSEFADGVLHSRGGQVADADEFDLWVCGCHAEKVSHVEVVEVDSGDAPFAGGHRGDG